MVNQYHIEVWKWIPNCEGEYEISTLGEIRSYKMRNPKILSFGVSDGGYFHLRMKGSTKKVHQLSAITFLGHTPCGYEIVVDHKDRNRQNNALSNLQLISHRENCTKDRNTTTGVFRMPTSGIYRASIYINGKSIHLGHFKTAEEAQSVYQEALQKHNSGLIVKDTPKKMTIKGRKHVYQSSRYTWRVAIRHKYKLYTSGPFKTEQDAYEYSIIFKPRVIAGLETPD